MTNIIDIYFDSVGSTATAPSKLWQWSKGQIVRINGLDLPTVYQVHFSNNPTLGTAEPVAVSGNMVSIPDIYLTTGEPVYLFIWLSDETSAETVRKGTIYVAKRSQPSGAYDPTAEQQTIIDGLIGSINTAVDTAEGYAESAQTYSGNAATSATEALNAKDAAQGYAEQASQTAQGVEILVNRAEDAADDAETAKQDVEQLKQAVEGLADDAESAKTDAETARGEAQGFAQTASTKASEASQSASQASQSATTAISQAQTATAKATEANQSAETATAKASEASASAATATTKASEASTSASTATKAKNDAVTAKNAAVTARTGAETARTGAEAAVQSVSASAAQIATNASDITDLKEDLSQNDAKVNLKINTIGNVAINEFDGIYAEKYSILSDGTFSASVNGRTAIIPCTASTVYFIKKIGTSNRLTIACGNKKYPVGEKVTIITPASANQSGCYEVTTSAEASYLYVYVSTQGETPELYVGNHEAYAGIPYNATRYIDQPKAEHIENVLSTGFLFNLFDGKYIENIGLLALNVNECMFTTMNNSRSIVVPAKAGVKYYIRTFDTHNRFRVGVAESLPTVGMKMQTIIETNVSKASHYNFTMPEGKNWIVFTVTNQQDEPRAQITEGEDSLAFLGYNSIKSREETGTQSVGYFFLDDIKGIFDAETVPSALDVNTTRVTDIYAIYDELVTNHPEYVGKSVLGTVSTESLEIRRYDFNALQIQNDSSYSLKKPKLILTAGIHGYEQGSAYCLARVMKHISEGTDDVSVFLRDNVNIIVVPVVNPYGYNHNQRKNENGVDLNRNFAFGWTASSDPTSENYSGTSANSEAETQTITALLEANADAFYVVDFHNIANGYPLMYLNNDKQVQFCNSLFVALTNKWRSDYSGFPTDRLLGYAKNGSDATLAMQAVSLEIPAFTAETPWMMPIIGQTKFDIITLTTGCDVIGNILTVIAKSMI